MDIAAAAGRIAAMDVAAAAGRVAAVDIAAALTARWMLTDVRARPVRATRRRRIEWGLLGLRRRLIASPAREAAHRLPGSSLGIAELNQPRRDAATGNGAHAGDGCFITWDAIAGGGGQRIDKYALDGAQAVGLSLIGADALADGGWVHGLKRPRRRRDEPEHEGQQPSTRRSHSR